MAFTKAFRITREPRTFQAGDYTGFNLSLGSKYYDRKLQDNKWSNYKAVIFAKGNQLNFYQNALVVGTIIELTADDLKIDDYNPEYLAIELLEPRVCGIFTNEAQQQPQQQQQQQQQQGRRQTNQQYNEPPEELYDVDTPF